MSFLAQVTCNKIANDVTIGDAVLEVVFEVDVNGILKVTATEKTSGRSANITISNSVGKLSSTEIETMINGKSSFHALIPLVGY